MFFLINSFQGDPGTTGPQGLEGPPGTRVSMIIHMGMVCLLSNCSRFLPFFPQGLPGPAGQPGLLGAVGIKV